MDHKKSGEWRLDKELPWLTKGSIGFIEQHIKKQDMVLEFGSGASTLFFARRARKVISFESGGYSIRHGTIDRSVNWYKKLAQRLQKGKIHNVELYLLQGYPRSAIVDRHVLPSLPDNLFDWVLVDGANRVLCIDLSRDKLKSGGYMIIDNYDHIPPAKVIKNMQQYMKHEYCMEAIKKYLDGWQEFRYAEEGWGGGTTILQKP